MFRTNEDFNFEGFYLLFIAHGDLNKDHREVTIALPGFEILKRVILLGNGFDLLESDPETSQTQNQPIHALDHEEHNTRIGEELQRWSEVLHPNQNPPRINPLEHTLNPQWSSPQTLQLVEIDMRSSDMPTLVVRHDLKPKQKHREPEEQFDTKVEPRSHGGVLLLSSAVNDDVVLAVVVVILGVSPTRCDAASDRGGEAEHCRANGCEAAGGAVGLEEQDPGELSRVLAAPVALVPGPTRPG